jgi:UDP-GlcNAc:undecaprenyl-phosphate GlcNAc-1-phosphate transferase
MQILPLSLSELHPALVAFVVALVLARPVMALCRRIGWIDKPNERKLHEGHVPLAGGILVALTVVVTFLVEPSLAATPIFWVSAAMVFSIGFIDDRYPIRARYRFGVQLAAALAFTIASGASVTTLGELIGPFQVVLGTLGFPLVVVGIAGLTNAVNMMDGVDGLASGLVLVALGWLLVVFGIVSGEVATTDAVLAAQATRAAETAALLIGALAAFTLFNQRTPWRRRAAMFLGDGGSMGLGFVLSAMLVYAAGAFGAYGMPPVVAVWIAAVPLLDIFTCIIRRIGEGITPMTPDRKHMHHLLMAEGLSPGKAVAVMQGTGFVAGLIGVGGWQAGVPDYLLFWAFVAAFSGYFAWSRGVCRRIDIELPPIQYAVPPTRIDLKLSLRVRRRGSAHSSADSDDVTRV